MRSIVLTGCALWAAWHFKDLIMIFVISISLVYLISPLNNKVKLFFGKLAPLISTSLLTASVFYILKSFFLIGKSALSKVSAQPASIILDLEKSGINISYLWRQISFFIKTHISMFALEGLSLAFGFLKVGLILLLAFYILSDWGKWINQTSSIMKKQEERIKNFLSKVDENMQKWAKGQFLTFMLLFPYYFVMLRILKFPFAAEFAVLSTFLSIIPYLGIGTCAMAATFVSIQFGFDLNAITLILSSFLLGMVLEGIALTPNLIGSKMEIHPILFIITSLILWQIFGLLGPIITSPILCTAKVLIEQTQD